MCDYKLMTLTFRVSHKLAPKAVSEEKFKRCFCAMAGLLGCLHSFPSDLHHRGHCSFRSVQSEMFGLVWFNLVFFRHNFYIHLSLAQSFRESMI